MENNTIMSLALQQQIHKTCHKIWQNCITLFHRNSKTTLPSRIPGTSFPTMSCIVLSSLYKSDPQILLFITTIVMMVVTHYSHSALCPIYEILLANDSHYYWLLHIVTVCTPCYMFCTLLGQVCYSKHKSQLCWM